MPISVTLSPKVDHLWHSVHALQNEMCATAAGRKIFPNLEYCVTGLDPQKMYLMRFHCELQDDKMLRFVQKKYVEVPSRENKCPPKKVWHHHGAQSGSHWMKDGVHFTMIKITNRKSNEDSSPSMIHLFSQHRYRPVLEIYEDDKMIAEARLEHTLFIPVTTYNNPAVNLFKTNNNPYAKRYRSDYEPKKSKVIKKQKTSDSISPLPNVSSGVNTFPMLPSIAPTSESSNLIPPLPMLPMFNPYLAMSFFNLYNPNFQFSNPMTPADSVPPSGAASPKPVLESDPVVKTDSETLSCFPTPSISPTSRQSPSSVNFRSVENFALLKEEPEDFIEVTVD